MPRGLAVSRALQNSFFSASRRYRSRSRHLKRELGVELFERRGPSIRLTAQGESLLELAQPFVQGIDGIAESFASELGDPNSGEINIVAGESTILYLLPEVIKQFADVILASALEAPQCDRA